MKQNRVTVNVEIGNIDEATKKVDELNQKLREAKTLADEIASMELEIIMKN